LSCSDLSPAPVAGSSAARGGRHLAEMVGMNRRGPRRFLEEVAWRGGPWARRSVREEQNGRCNLRGRQAQTCGRVQVRVKLSRQIVAVRSMRRLAPAGRLESGS
jgi:hypothetical protein